MANLEKFSKSAKGKIDFVGTLNQQVGTAPLPPVKKSFKLTDKEIRGLPVKVSGNVMGSVRIYSLEEAVSIFDFDTPGAPKPSKGLAGFPGIPGSLSLPEEAQPPSDHAFTELLLVVGAGISSTIDPVKGPTLSLSANASASGELRYRLLDADRRTVSKKNAIESLVVRARPPHLVNLGSVAPHSLHTLDARFQLGFNVEASVGQEFDFSEVIELFDEMSLQVRAHATRP